MKIYIPYKRINLSREKIIAKYFRFKKRYTKYISYKNKNYLAIFFSIMIMENYNRPWYLRIIEYSLFIFRKVFFKEVNMTLGIMQIRTPRLIGNIRSIRLADRYIYEEYRKYSLKETTAMIEGITYKYNPSKLYREEIFKIYNYIIAADMSEPVSDTTNSAYPKGNTYELQRKSL